MQDGFSISDSDFSQVRMVDLEYWYSPFDNYSLDCHSQQNVDGILSQVVRCEPVKSRKKVVAQARLCAAFLRYCSPDGPDPAALGWVTMYLFLIGRLNNLVGSKELYGELRRVTACIDGEINNDLYGQMDPFERELAQIFHRFPSNYPQEYLQFRHAFSLNMSAFLAESSIPSGSKTTSELYRHQRRHTISVVAYLRLWKLLDRQFEGIVDEELILCDYLEGQAAEIQGYANDLCSIHIDIARNQGNNALIMAEEQGLGVGTASRKILMVHDDHARSFDQVSDQIVNQAVQRSSGFLNYVKFIRSCISGNLYAMAELSQRYST